jgi:predicted component of type VI protein secretion system
MKQNIIATAAFAFVLILSVAGCVTRTTTIDTPRQSIRFTTPVAAQLFYDNYRAERHYDHTNWVSVTIPLPYRHWTRSTDNVRFNNAVKLADTDHDGDITEDEAWAFAAAMEARLNPPAKGK